MRPTMDVAKTYVPVGLSVPRSRSFADGPGTSPSESGSALPIATILAHNQELTAELNRLRADRERWVDVQRQIMELLASKSPDRILHDLRNVLNERELFRSLADLGE